MLVINVQQIKEARALRELKVKVQVIEINGKAWNVANHRQAPPPPKAEVTPAPSAPQPAPEIIGVERVYVAAEIARSKEEIKSNLISSLEIEYNGVMKERKILSSQIWKMVENGASKEELAAHYERIESYRPALQKLYDDIKYAKQYGTLPQIPEIVSDPQTIASLKMQKRPLIDKRSKLKAKLAKKVSNPEKYVQWELELAQTEAMLIDVTNSLKKLEGKA